jgi:phage tail sheath protein FI
MALQVYGYSDNQGYVWDAPAGARRGLVVGVDSVGYVTGTLGTATTFVECNLNPGQRDNLYQFYNNINPIVYFPGRGILIWGQKTSATAASAMDRVNVVRLVMYLKRALRKGSFPFIFEPNDKITRDDYKAAADGILGDVMAKRGLYDFATLCDESNNTPTRIDNNEMYLDVAIKPTKTAEFLYVIMRVLSTGAEMPG